VPFPSDRTEPVVLLVRVPLRPTPISPTIRLLRRWQATKTRTTTVEEVEVAFNSSSSSSTAEEGEERINSKEEEEDPEIDPEEGVVDAKEDEEAEDRTIVIEGDAMRMRTVVWDAAAQETTRATSPTIATSTASVTPTKVPQRRLQVETIFVDAGVEDLKGVLEAEEEVVEEGGEEEEVEAVVEDPTIRIRITSISIGTTTTSPFDRIDPLTMIPALPREGVSIRMVLLEVVRVFLRTAHPRNTTKQQI